MKRVRLGTGRGKARRKPAEKTGGPAGVTVLPEDAARVIASDYLIDRELLTRAADGRIVVNGVKLSGLRRDARMRVMLQVIEAHALLGSVDAAKAALGHHRWAEEMVSGRARQRIDATVRPAPVIDDDLGTRRDLGSERTGAPLHLVQSQDQERITSGQMRNARNDGTTEST